MGRTHNPELERAIHEAIDDPAGYLVYADWLQSQGDPHGELIMLQHARLQTPDDERLRAAEAELLDSHRDVLFGEVAAHLQAFHFEWWLGFVRAARMHGAVSLAERGAARVLEALLALPCARFLRSLTLGHFELGRDLGRDRGDLLRGLFGRPKPATIEHLFLFDDPWPGGRQVAEISALEAGFPGLRSLALGGWVALTEGQPLPNLRRVRLHGGSQGMIERNMRALRAAATIVQRLEIHGSGLEDERQLTSWLGPFGGLRQLAVHDCADAPALCRELKQLSLSLRLSVELSSAELSAEEASALQSSHRGAFAALQVRAGGFVARQVQRVGAGEPDALEQLRDSAGAGLQLYNTGTQLLIAGKDLESAVRMLDASLDLPDPRFRRQAWSNAAIAHANRGEFDEAITIARRGILDYPNEPNYWAIVIDALRHQRRLDEALQAVAQGRTHVTPTAEGLALLEDCMLTLLYAGQPRQAAELYTDFVEAHPRSRPRQKTAACAAIVYAQLGDLQATRAAVQQLRGCAEPVVHHARACLHAMQRRWSRARAEIERARQHDYVELRFMLEEDPLLRRVPSARGERGQATSS